MFGTPEIQSFLLVLVSNMSIIKTLGNCLKLFQISRLVLVRSWYWSQTNFNFKISCGIRIEVNLKSRQVLVINKGTKGPGSDGI